MSLLARAIPARKGIDQLAQAGSVYPSVYVPLENHQRWTGLGISPETAFNVITVYQCVRILANTFAQVPLLLYRRRPDGGKERATDHPLYRTFHLAPNPKMSSFTWRQLMMGHLATWGNHYSEVVRVGSTVELWPIRPDRIEVRWGSGNTKRYIYLHPTDGPQDMRPGSIFHVQGLTTDGLVGMSPIAVMRRALKLYNSAERFGESVFDNGARPGGYLSHPGEVGAPAITRLAQQMDELRGAGNAAKTVVLEEGLAFHEVGFPPEDAQFMETRLFQKREITGGFGVPSSMTNDPSDEEADEDQESRKFIKRTMVPYWTGFEQDAQLQVIADETLFVEFLADGYLRGDPKARADAFAVQWEHGNLSNDEWRAAENLDPLPDELGKIYYRPANWVRVDEEEPQPVGGDASIDTQFGAGLVDQVTRAKVSDGQRCPHCASKIAERLTAPYRLVCRHCKGIVEDTTEQPEDDVASLRAAIHALPTPIVNVPQPVVNVPAPVVNVESPNVNVEAPTVNVDNTVVAEAVAKAVDAMRDAMTDVVEEMTSEMRRPRTVVRDANGRITGAA